MTYDTVEMALIEVIKIMIQNLFTIIIYQVISVIFKLRVSYSPLNNLDITNVVKVSKTTVTVTL